MPHLNSLSNDNLNYAWIAETRTYSWVGLKVIFGVRNQLKGLGTQTNVQFGFTSKVLKLSSHLQLQVW